MVFSSLSFLLIFLPILIYCYFIINNIKSKNIILLVFSLVFYAWGEPIYITLMIFSIFITYLFGILIDKYDYNKKVKKTIFIISIFLQVVLLLFFKYGNFFISNFNYIFNLKIKYISLSLPIGISFYTFQAISYVVDVYTKKVKVQKNFFNLALYISLFPQLIAGPIVRYETIENEITKRTHTLEKVEIGLKRFIIGLSKKVILANNVASIADVIFNNSNSYGSLILWLGALSYTLQIYFDFSGYSDMAIGLGKIFGFSFLENFNYPYTSKSITEFWRRWHISLSSWFRDYIYIPLGGSRVNFIKHICNIFIVWILTGFWHGASWNFVLWGMYYCILLLIEKFLLKKFLKKIPSFFQHFLTLFLIIIGWVIFRITDLSVLIYILKCLFIYKSSSFADFIYNNTYLITNFYFLIISTLFCLPVTFKFVNDNKDKFIVGFSINIVYILLFIINLSFLVSNTYNPFIYFRF